MAHVMFPVGARVVCWLCGECIGAGQVMLDRSIHLGRDWVLVELASGTRCYFEYPDVRLSITQQIVNTLKGSGHVQEEEEHAGANGEVSVK